MTTPENLTSLRYSKMLKEHGWNIKTNYIRIGKNVYDNCAQKPRVNDQIYPAPNLGELLENISTTRIKDLKWVKEKNKADALAKLWCEQQKEIIFEKKLNLIKSIKFSFKLEKLSKKDTKKFLYIYIGSCRSLFWCILTGKDLKDAIKREIYNDKISNICYDIFQILEFCPEYFDLDGDFAILSEKNINNLINEILNFWRAESIADNVTTVIYDVTDHHHIKLIYPKK
jgi:hypothetical protein